VTVLGNALCVEDLCYSIGKMKILDHVSLEVTSGRFIGIIGPNGSGKSTLLKTICKVLSPTSGRISVYGEDLRMMSNRRMAKYVSVVAQESEAVFDFTVEEVVLMGRYHKKKALDTMGDSDRESASLALGMMRMQSFGERSFLSLSGGEKQRALIARAMAQDTEIILLDEPTNHLDAGSQIMTLETLKSSGKTVVAALHDLGIASRYCDEVYILQKGALLRSGPPRDVITNDLIEELYDINGEVFWRKKRLFIDYA
jgi:iron complex transport system ATP-binding protein